MSKLSITPDVLDHTLEPTEVDCKNDHMTAIIDLDWPKYTVASVVEETVLNITHKASGNVKEFKNISTFKGLGKKIGGWLGDRNAEREEQGKSLFALEDFEIEPVQRVKKVKRSEKDKKKGDSEYLSLEEIKVNMYYSAKMIILSALKALGTNKYEAILGAGDSFRVNLSTLLKYKGDRDNVAKPILLQDLLEFLESRFNPTTVRGIEADDAVVIRAFGDENAVIVGEDKDYRGQPVKFFDINNPDEGIIDGDCFGELTWSGKKVSGYGRIFLYWQMISEDKVDCYKFNCKSDTKFGGKGAYDVLVDCKDDKEAIEKMIELGKRLYPEPQVVESWQGHKFSMDYMYVLREMFLMARMKTSVDDMTTFDNWMTKYGVEYDY